MQRYKFVRSEYLRNISCFVPMSKNLVFYELRNNLFNIIKKRMSDNSRQKAEYVEAKEMYSWVSSGYKLYLNELIL